MTEFEIQEQDSTPLIGFQEFFINFQTSSIFHRAYVFDEIRFALPYVSVKVGKDGHVNLAALGHSEETAPSPEKAASSEEPAAPSSSPATGSDTSAELPAVIIGHFEIAQGIVEYRDASKANPVSVDVVPINLSLKNFHTRRGGDNSYSFVAELGKNEILDWNGTVSLEPIASEGTLSLSGVRIATLFQYVRDQFQFDIPDGKHPSDRAIPVRVGLIARLRSQRNTAAPHRRRNRGKRKPLPCHHPPHALPRRNSCRPCAAQSRN